VNSAWQKLRLVLLGAAALAYVVLGYIASSSRHPPAFAVLVGAIPVAFGLVAACWQSTFRYLATTACLAVIIFSGWHFDLLLSHAAWIYFFQHAGTMIALCIMFGGTLKTHEGALCSRIAAIAIAEPLDAVYLRYTWKVTLAWTIYFALSASLSIGLFLAATLEAWSLFAAVITPISVPLMFAVEFMVRQRALPGRPHFSIAQTIQSYRNYTQRRKVAE
jgi:uncharacterized membrane protein